MLRHCWNALYFGAVRINYLTIQWEVCQLTVHKIYMKTSHIKKTNLKYSHALLGIKIKKTHKEVENIADSSDVWTIVLPYLIVFWWRWRQTVSFLTPYMKTGTNESSGLCGSAHNGMDKTHSTKACCSITSLFTKKSVETKYFKYWVRKSG